MKKSALQQAIIDTNEVVKAITENTKSNFAIHIKNTIGQSIAESLEIDDKDNEVATDEVVVTDEPKADEVDTDEPKADDTELSVDEPKTDDALETPTSDEVVVTDEPEGDNVVATDVISDEPDSDDIIDMTGASDDDLIKVWKKLSDDAEIQVVKNDDDSINITTPSGEEFMVKINEDVFNAIDEEINAFENSLNGGDDKYSFLDNASNDDNGINTDDEEIMFEIELDEEIPSEIHIDVDAPMGTPSNDNQDLPPAPTGDPLANQVLEDDINEVARTHADGRNMTRKPEGFLKYAASLTRNAVNENETANKELILENTNLVAENKSLKDELEEYKNTLRIVKEQLETVAVVNTKMLYVNQLFCENATTTDEKKAILKRFDAIKNNGSQQDVKDLYKTIVNEMANRVSVKETIAESISTPVGNTGETLLESVNPNQMPFVNRIKEIMNYNPANR